VREQWCFRRQGQQWERQRKRAGAEQHVTAVLVAGGDEQRITAA